jgi:glycosyltransferase involved in cell wall biosynthesis
MKIAIDARIIRTSTGRYVERLLHYLQKIDHENQYVILLDKKDFDGWTPTNPNFSKVSIDIPNYSFKEQINYVRLLRTLKVDLVHFTMPQQPLLYSGPSVTTIHDLTLLHFKNYEESSKIAYNIKQFIFGFVMRFAVSKSRVVITPTEYVKQDLIKTLHANPDKIVVTLESAEPSEAQAQPIAELADKSFIMYVGRMDPYKNIRRLIQAHQQLIKSQPNLQLALPGAKDGNVQILEQWVKDQGFKNVHFLGFIPDDQLKWLFKNTRAYVFPSLSEGFGLPPLEAMTHGAPVVSSNATCLPEVNKNGAHYFDPASIEDMADKINDVLKDKTLRDNLIREGAKVVASYSWERMAEETLEVYEHAYEKKNT